MSVPCSMKVCQCQAGFESCLPQDRSRGDCVGCGGVSPLHCPWWGGHNTKRFLPRPLRWHRRFTLTLWSPDTGRASCPGPQHNTSRNDLKWEQPRWRKGERRFNSLDLVYLIIGFGFITSRMTPRH